jgi:hypothetical protein
MAYLQRYYNRRARTLSLNGATFVTALFAFYSCIGLFQLLKYFQHHDPFYLYAGPINILLGVAGVFQGTNLIHAVVRRLIAEARTASPHSIPAGN